MKKTAAWLLIVLPAVLLPGVLSVPSHYAAGPQGRAEGIIDNLPPRAGYRSPGARHKIQVTDPALALDLESEGGRLIADYGAYQLLEVDGKTLESLEGKAGVEIRDDYNLILLNASEIDTTLEDRKPRAREASSAAAQKRLHLVQFPGPIKPEWYDQLVDTGVEIVSYIPNNAYLVYGDRKSLRRVRALTGRRNGLQWEGEYKDAFKVSPGSMADQKEESLQAQAADGLYAIQLIEDKETNPETIQLIDQYKQELLVSWEILNYVNLVVRIPVTAVTPISKRADLVTIQPYVMPQKFDERQNQIVAGNLTGTSPTPGDWLAYLAAHGFTQAQFTASGFSVNISDSGVDNATTTPNHFGLYVGGLTANPSRLIYNRLEGTPHAGSTLQGCDGHGNINAHIVGGFVPFAFGSGFPHTDAAGFRFGLGVCPFVTMGSSVIFDPSIFTNPNLVNLESKAYNDGARISTNSWGANVAGAYNVTSQTFDAIVRDAQSASSTFPAAGNQEYVVVFAAGNSGPGAQTVGAPGTAKNVITVGAAENVHSHSTANGGNTANGSDGCGIGDTGADSADDIISFSSRGPSADGRKKPDIVAPGTHVTGGVFQIASPPANGQADACFNATGVCALPGSGTVGDPDNFFPLGQQFYTTSSGTSHSTPAVAGAAALVRQHFINQGLSVPSPAMTKAGLMNSARYLTGISANDSLWSNNQGMGEVHLNQFFDIFSTPSILKDQVPADTFTSSGQIRVVGGSISDSSKPFRVTLVWTDAPGPTSGNAFVNNLDLEVTVGGNTYLGNVFSGASSATGGSADPRNNAESVFLPAGTTGNFAITVRATNIAGNGVPNVGGPLDQDFALVIYNAVEAPLPAITPAAATITAESCLPANGVIDPNETVTVDLSLMNVGTGNTTNLVATLQSTGGVTSPSGPQNYGTLVAGGPSVTRSFTFTAQGACGGALVATLQLQDGSADLGTVTFTFTLGSSTMSTQSFSNTMSIAIPATGTSGPASPYPSNISVSGLTGTVSKVTVTLTNLNHTFPDDVDVLLVGPAGQKVIVMSDVGGSADAVNVSLTLDDAAALSLPDAGPLVSGTFRPTNIGAGDTFAAPAPAGPYDSVLSAFNGSNPNGDWSLFVMDDVAGDSGSLAGGWSITVTASTPVCCMDSCMLTCPANITTPANPGQCGAVVNYPPSMATGICGVVVCSPASGSFFPVGTTTVTCTATDTTACSFTVTVVDSTPPSITCPANITMQGSPGTGSTVVNYPAPVATDNCPLSVVCNPPSGSAFAPGTTTVVCTATNSGGNTATCSFTISLFNVVVRDDASGTFIRFASKSGGGATAYQFFDCRKNITFSGTGMVTTSFCKIELKDGGTKTSTQNVSVIANTCTLAGSASVKLPGSSTTYKLTDANIANNPLTCP